MVGKFGSKLTHHLMSSSLLFSSLLFFASLREIRDSFSVFARPVGPTHPYNQPLYFVFFIFLASFAPLREIRDVGVSLIFR
jgi:hypothetical protein